MSSQSRDERGLGLVGGSLRKLDLGCDLPELCQGQRGQLRRGPAQSGLRSLPLLLGGRLLCYSCSESPGSGSTRGSSLLSETARDSEGTAGSGLTTRPPPGIVGKSNVDLFLGLGFGVVIFAEHVLQVYRQRTGDSSNTRGYLIPAALEESRG